VPARFAAPRRLPPASPRSARWPLARRAQPRAPSLEKTLAGLHGDWNALLQMEREERDLDLAAGREDDGPLDDVLQLSQVAGPRIALEQIERLRSEAVNFLLTLASASAGSGGPGPGCPRSAPATAAA